MAYLAEENNLQVPLDDNTWQMLTTRCVQSLEADTELQEAFRRWQDRDLWVSDIEHLLCKIKRKARADQAKGARTGH